MYVMSVQLVDNQYMCTLLIYLHVTYLIHILQCVAGLYLRTYF